MPVKRKVKKSKKQKSRMRILPVKSKQPKRPKVGGGRMRILPIRKQFV